MMSEVLETMNRFNGPVSFMSSGPAACRVPHACARKNVLSFLLLTSHEWKRDTR